MTETDKTILIVEDSVLNRKLVETILKAEGYRLLMAADGEAAIKIATAEQPDLILMDMQLPQINGYEATRILKAQLETVHIPIVALTAYAMPEEREQSLETGCDGYITKPINTRAFPHQVRKYLEE